MGSNPIRDTMKNSEQKRNEKIRQYQIWLIGDRCDGWEKQVVETNLRKLQEEQSHKIESSTDSYVSGWRWL